MCDTMVHVRSDGVLFAKNSDRDPNEAQVLEWRQAADHPPGATVHCTWIAIPQVAHTHAVLLSRPFWHWGAEMGANEHGVVIGNEAVFTDAPYAPSGLTGMDLLRLGLERAGTAEDAVSVIVALLEKHGQGGGCGLERRSFTYHNSFLVADAEGAIVLETAGRAWATEAVRSGARSISNGLTISDFAEAHGERLRYWVAAGRVRRAATEASASRAAAPRDLMGALRQHGTGDGPRYTWVHGGMAAPCMHAGGLVASSQTTASWVSSLGADTAHWATATAAPCTSIFKPVSVAEPLDLGDPRDTDDGTSLWWRHERLHRAALRDPKRSFPHFVPARDDMEATFLAERPTSREAFGLADAALRVWTAAVGTPIETRPWYARRYWARRDAWASAKRDRATKPERPGEW
jgi:secernin